LSFGYISYIHQTSHMRFALFCAVCIFKYNIGDAPFRLLPSIHLSLLHACRRRVCHADGAYILHLFDKGFRGGGLV